MTKFSAIVFALICVISLVGCSSNSISGIDKAVKIVITQYEKANGGDTGTATITEEESIKHIVDNLNSLKLKKMNGNEPTILEYVLTFYNSNEEEITTISIPPENWVCFDGYLYSISKGELNRAYIEGLIESTE